MNNFTKYTFTIILIWLSFNAFAQSNKFVIQTNFVKKIKVIDKAANTNYFNIIWEQIKNSWASITSFFTFARNGLVEQERGAFLKSTDVGLYFTQPDSLEIARIEDLAIDWKTSEKKVIFIN